MNKSKPIFPEILKIQTSMSGKKLSQTKFKLIEYEF